MISGLTLMAIKAEGMKQDHKWGIQDHEPEVWLAILVEEVGELGQAILADRFDKNRDQKMHASHSESMEMEAIQVAAVAAHFVEYLSRKAGLTVRGPGDNCTSCANGYHCGHCPNCPGCK